MDEKLWVIGDVHGYSLALSRLLDHITPNSTDTVVTLGDHIDRGPDTRGVIERLMRLRRECRLVTLLGNHEDIMFKSMDVEFCRQHDLGIWLPEDLNIKNFWQKSLGILKPDKHKQMKKDWLQLGGIQTLMSYGPIRGAEEIPLEHLRFLAKCPLYYETEEAIFAHAGYEPQLPMKRQPRTALLYTRLAHGAPPPHMSGKKAYVGHSAQRNGQILDLGHIICLDTCLYGGGWLTAIEVRSGRILQVDAAGRLRNNGQ